MSSLICTCAFPSTRPSACTSTINTKIISRLSSIELKCLHTQARTTTKGLCMYKYAIHCTFASLMVSFLPFQTPYKYTQVLDVGCWSNKSTQQVVACPAHSRNLFEGIFFLFFFFLYLRRQTTKCIHVLCSNIIFNFIKHYDGSVRLQHTIHAHAEKNIQNTKT